MLTNGSLLLFAFFMISDPRTTPDSRAGRILFAVLVALGAGLVQFVLYRTNGPLWSLAACSLFVPLLDRRLPGARHTWTRAIPAGSGRVDASRTVTGLRVRCGESARAGTSSGVA